MMMALILESILPMLVLTGLGSWLAYHLVRQNGRILMRVEALENRMLAVASSAARAVAPSGLPIGTAAPEFELPDLAGGRSSLSQFRGRRLLLIFFNPGCGHCIKLVDALAALPAENGHAHPLVVSTGDPESSRYLFERQGVRCPVLIQEKFEIAARYHANGTPTGYLIDESGAIASDLARGTDALLALAQPGAPPRKKSGCGCGGKAKANDHNHNHGHGNKSLADSRIERSGLKPGTPAPAFRLPRLDGGDWGLEDDRGQRVLLVFSDPECAPCDELAPRLELLHRDRKDVRVVMVGRRDLDLVRQKAAKFGLTLPIVFQKNWELSVKFGIFVTPVGFLIDETGVIAAEVAKGVQPILDLVTTVEVPLSSTSRQSAARGMQVAVN